MAFGETYPTRSGVPQSSVVPYAQNPTDWGTDWSNREMAQQAKGPGQTFSNLLWQQVNDYAKSANIPGHVDPTQGVYDGMDRGKDFQSAFDFARGAFSDPSGAALTGQAPGTSPVTSPRNRDIATSMFGDDFYPTLNQWTWKDAPSTMRREQRALEDEKTRMMPGLQAQTFAQKAYDTGLLADGQTNGRMSADYSNPGFGQINGDFGQDRLGQSNFGQNTTPAMAGVTALPSTIWGAAPQRVRQWGI